MNYVTQGDQKYNFFLFNLLFGLSMLSWHIFHWNIFGEICFSILQISRIIYLIFMKIFPKMSKIESVSVILYSTCIYISVPYRKSLFEEFTKNLFKKYIVIAITEPCANYACKSFICLGSRAKKHEIFPSNTGKFDLH